MGRKKGKRKKQITIKDPETLAVLGTILMVISVLLLLSMFFDGNLFTLFRKQLGYGVVVMAVVGFAVGFRLMGMSNKYNTVRVIVSLLIFFFSFLGWIHLFVPDAEALKVAELGKNGGLVGLAIRDLFFNIFGQAGAFGVLTPIMITALLTSLYISPKEFWVFVVKVINKIFIALKWLVQVFISKNDNSDVEIKMEDNKKKKDKKDNKIIAEDDSKKPHFVTEIMNGGEEEVLKRDDEKQDKPNQALTSSNISTTPVSALRPHDSSVEQIKKYPNWILPSTTLLDEPKRLNFDATASILKYSSAIERTLVTFGIVGCKIKGYSHGPSVTRYNLDLAPGIKFSKIESLSRDLGLALAASSDLRIAPIPNTSFIGIEVPNEKVEPVTMREVLEGENISNYALPLSLGKDISGKAIMKDLATMPHMLIAGATGSGKSVLENACIMTMLFRYSPDDLKLIMIDPKMVEMTGYNGIPHLITPPITDMDKAVNALKWALVEMNNRYKMFTEKKVRDIKQYNSLMGYQALPYIVIVIDEMADLIITHGATVQGPIIRLAQLARAAGMHLMLATQRPSVDVITGLMKANIPARIGLRVSSAVDSRVVLDSNGAETLLGKGDMLVKTTDKFGLARVQGLYLSDREFEKVIDFIKDQAGEVIYDESITESQEAEAGAKASGGKSTDDLFDKCVEIVITAQKASASLLQTKLNIGYNRAARLIQEMEDKGIISAPDGSKPRKVLVSEWAIGGGDIPEE
ncbi:MAG: DNA translocase FtsK [bacterium]